MAPSQKFDYSYAHYNIITLENVKLRKRFILLKFDNANIFI